MSEVIMAIFELPVARKMAAPPLYNAINGIDADTINR